MKQILRRLTFIPPASCYGFRGNFNAGDVYCRSPEYEHGLKLPRGILDGSGRDCNYLAHALAKPAGRRRH